MAVIKPFRGILYNQDMIEDLGDVVTPPYDVISEQQRQEYFDRHPENIVRLILSQGNSHDTDKNNRYTRAADFFRKWQDKGILIRDHDPTIYLTAMDFKSEGLARTRLGFVVLVRLENFHQGGIIPHEKTFSATKQDRLRLMKACKANFSPIFSVFSDPDDEVNRIFRGRMEKVPPDFIFQEVIGYRHRLWRIRDQGIHGEIEQKLANKKLYIADGHHRYETALNYRNEIMKGKDQFAPSASYNFVMMYLSSMQDPGLIIRPVNRMLSHAPEGTLDGFIKKAGTFFDIEVMDIGNKYDEIQSSFVAKIRAGAKHGVIGAVIRGHKAVYVLKVKNGVMGQLFEGEIPVPLRRLDVTITTKLVFQQILGLINAELDDEKRILYTSRTSKAFDAISSGNCVMALILNPTRLSDIEEISKAGLVMPRKSTYFFPKVVSGLVINKLD